MNLGPRTRKASPTARPNLDSQEAALRQAYVGVLSHELRTPITSIYGGTQLLLRGAISSELRATVTNDIAAEAEHLYRLVEDLLAIARIEGGLTKPVDEPVSMQQQAREAAGWVERHSPGRRVDVSSPRDLPAVRGDTELVGQILRNLISNAATDSPPDTIVEVVVAELDAEVTVRVLDRGRGIAQEAGDDAFRLFANSPGVAYRQSGTGIGLFVARTLAEAQGGRVWLGPRPGGGAEVGVALPVYAPGS